MKNKITFSFTLLFLIFLNFNLHPQEVDIIPYLKMIEGGEKSNALSELYQLKVKHPDDPSVLFLEGVLIDDGKKAVDIYNKVVSNYPESKYADASLYRIFSYYYAIGLYKTADNYLTKLKDDYPYSPYIKIAERNLPDKDEFVEAPNTLLDDKQKEPEEIIEKPATDDFKFTIQAGAFSKFENASALKNDFETAGFYSEIIEKNVGGTHFNVVLVGKFIDEEEARSFLQVINSEFNLEGRVVLIQK